MVCTANICRSPAIASLLAARLGPAVEVLSRGTEAVTGAPACEASATWALAHGTGLASHTSTPLSLRDIRASTVILTATRRHRRAVIEQRPSAQVRTFTLAQAARIAMWLEGTATTPPDASVPDRLLWLVEELDASRGAAPLPLVDEEDDLPDPHHGADHAAVFERIATAVAAFRSPIRG